MTYTITFMHIEYTCILCVQVQKKGTFYCIFSTSGTLPVILIFTMEAVLNSEGSYPQLLKCCSSTRWRMGHPANLRFGCVTESDVASQTKKRLSNLFGKILQPQRNMSDWCTSNGTLFGRIQLGRDLQGEL